jgi:hypothetical protein
METLGRVVVALVIVLLFLLFLVVALPFRLVSMLTENDREYEPGNEGDPACERESEAASTRAARAAAIPASEGVQPRVRIDATNTR